MTTSFEGGLVPPALRARARTKYTPGGAFAWIVVVRPTSTTTRLLAPDCEPASSRNVVGGAPPGPGVQFNVTSEPALEKLRPTGASGAGTAPPPICTTISFEAGPTPAPLTPFTLT